MAECGLGIAECGEVFGGSVFSVQREAVVMKAAA